MQVLGYLEILIQAAGFAVLPTKRLHQLNWELATYNADDESKNLSSVLSMQKL